MSRAVIGILLLAGCGSRLTADSVTVLEEDADSVLIEHDGQQARLFKHFAHGFEPADFASWFGDDGWTQVNLQSPAAPRIEDWLALREAIFAGEADFIDNRIDASTEQVLEGASSARFEAVEPDGVTSKSMVQYDSLWFVQGDDLWFRGHYYIEDAAPFTLADFQERNRPQSPGPRITIWEGTHLGVELKHTGKPRRSQSVRSVPIGRWFELKVHLELDADEGQVRIWQDGELLLDDRMRTLPKRNSILNALEVGITATDQHSVLWVDDVRIAHEPL